MTIARQVPTNEAESVYFQAIRMASEPKDAVSSGMQSQCKPEYDKSPDQPRAVKFSVFAGFIPYPELPEPVGDSLPQIIPAA